MDKEFDADLDRVAEKEEGRILYSGFGSTKQAEAYEARRLDVLAAAIHEARNTPRRTHNKVWALLRQRSDEDLAAQLLWAGLNSTYSYQGEHCYGHSAERIGEQLGFRRQDRKIEVGAWGLEVLTKALPREFWLDDCEVLTLHLTDEIDALMDEAVIELVAASPLVLPLADKPAPWTGFHNRVAGPQHWSEQSLIRRSGPRIENVARKAIGTGKMQPALAAANAAQDVFLRINEPALERVDRLGLADSRDIRNAQVLASRGAFTVPKNYDFRGRMYDVTHFGFQRDDSFRGMITFDHGEPITEDGTLQLMSHVAACADGNDWLGGVKKPGKLNFKKRLRDDKALAEKLTRINHYNIAKPHEVAARMLAQNIYDTIENTITCAKVFRDFIEGIAREYINRGEEFRWEVHGFPVLNIYLEPETTKLSLRVDGQWRTRRRTITAVVGDSEIVRGPKAIRAASPNFVHSIDGCHSRMVILTARGKGIETIPVHDCWATIAPRVKELNEIMRDRFIELHRQPFVAELLERARRDLPNSAKLPKLPKMGDFEATVEPIRHSFHAFK
jgi:hypothetical protein